MTISQGLSRRNFILGSTAGAALLASGAGAQTVPAPINDVTSGATFRWIDSGDQKAVFFKKLFAEYAAARDVNIVYDPLPWNEIARVIPLGVRNETAPDVFVLPRNTSLADAVAQGWLQPYDDFIPDIETWKASFPTGAFLPGINVFDGKTYGLPFTSNKRYSTHLLYNKDYMEAAGFDPAETPLTQSEFREAARKTAERDVFGKMVLVP